MASLFKLDASPYWYLRYRDPDGKWKQKSLKPLRHRIGTDSAEARRICSEYTTKEQTITVGDQRNQRWDSWVAEFIEIKYANKSPLTQTRYRSAWYALENYFETLKITLPRELTHEHCMKYIPWRKKTRLGHKKMVGSHNTALLELKVLGAIMEEANRRGFATGNPARSLGIGREAAKEKPELTDSQIIKIRELLAKPNRDPWMRHAFEVALAQGCRISETAVPMQHVDLQRGVIYFKKVKGGETKSFTAPINPTLVPLIEERIAARAVHLVDLPKNAPKLFHQLFKNNGLEGISFHCTRVTVVTRLARSQNVQEWQAMAVVNHSSELVHRIYKRVRSADVAHVFDALALPTQGSVAGAQTPRPAETPDAPSTRPKHP